MVSAKFDTTTDVEFCVPSCAVRGLLLRIHAPAALGLHTQRKDRMGATSGATTRSTHEFIEASLFTTQNVLNPVASISR